MGKVSERWLTCTHKTLTGQEYKVVEYKNSSEVTVEFLRTGTLLTTSTNMLRAGDFKDKMARVIFGVACIGEGKFTPAEYPNVYGVWWAMLDRCYGPEYDGCAYVGCTTAEGWLNFQNFAPFYLYDTYRQEGWHMDKDLLFSGNKVYSEETCVFLPLSLNVLLAVQKKKSRENLPQGVSRCRQKYQSRAVLGGEYCHFGTFQTPQESYLAYKEKKEAYVQSQADTWSGLIDPRAVEALRCWTLPDSF